MPAPPCRRLAWQQPPAPLLLAFLLAAVLVSFACGEASPPGGCSPDWFWRRYARPSAAALAASAGAAAPAFRLPEWDYGRFGNNFAELRNALALAVCCDGVVEAAAHRDLPHLQRWLDFSDGSVPKSVPFNKTGRCGSLNGSKALFAGPPECGVDSFAALSTLALGNALPRGCALPPDRCVPGLGDALVVHVRSGDAMRRLDRHSAQPPVAFYEAAFSFRNWSRIIMLTEPNTDLLNPVWCVRPPGLVRTRRPRRARAGGRAGRPAATPEAAT